MYIGRCPDLFGAENRLDDDPIVFDGSTKTKEELIAEAREHMVNQVLADAERTRDLFLKMRNEYLLKKNS